MTPVARSGSGLGARAYVELRDAIVRGELAPGEPLFEIHMAARLGMSRTPVREALKELAREGLVEVLPARGYLVPRRSLDDLRELFELRESLEGMAARYAALRASDIALAQLQRLTERYEREKSWEKWAAIGSDFHDAIIAAAGNERLKTLLRSLNSQIVMSRRSALRADASRTQSAISEHRAIFEAIRARDAGRAQQIASEHVRRSYEATLNVYQDRSFTASGR